jgi:alpha-D-ribose 1-methylphosphonate 5-phosphate C-P lyase
MPVAAAAVAAAAVAADLIMIKTRGDHMPIASDTRYCNQSTNFNARSVLVRIDATIEE